MNSHMFHFHRNIKNLTNDDISASIDPPVKEVSNKDIIIALTWPLFVKNSR